MQGNDDDGMRAFYDRLSADYHLVLVDWERAIRRQGEVLDRLIRAERRGAAGAAASAAEVLDCACGIGTQALGLAALGHRVTASDLSAAAVARAEAEAARRGLRLSFRVADMRELADAVPGAFDVVLAADNALPHLLREADLRRAARAMAGKLRPGGLLLASIRDYDEALARRPTATEPVFATHNGGRRRIVHQVWEWLDERAYRVHLHITREAPEGGWRCDHHVGRYRALCRDELTGYLREAGLADVRWLMPAESGYYQPIVVARRP